jgi:pimeloyl-ACP methyl ester carboxylesterase
MLLFRWIATFLSMPFLWEAEIPLVRPSRIDWNPSLSPKTIRINDRSFFYVEKGEGETLLLIHGFGAGMWIWEKQIEILSRSYKVYALDLVGHGFSDRPKIDYTYEAYIQFLKAFMDGVGIGKATLIGNSMGGGIAWAMAVFHPDRVSRLILIDCVPPDVLGQVRNDSFKALAAIKNIPWLLHLVIAGRTKNSVKWILHECVSDVSLITPEVLDRQYRLSRIKGTTWALYSTFKNGEKVLELKDRFSNIRHPALLIWGERDLIFPPSVGEALHQNIRGSKFHLVKKSGHIPMWETSEEVNPVILSFLNE